MRIFSTPTWRASGSPDAEPGFSGNTPALDTGRTIPAGDILFSGKSKSDENFDADSKALDAMKQAFGRTPNPELSFQVDARQDASRQTVSGTVDVLKDLLEIVETRIKGRTSDSLMLVATYPDAANIDTLESTIKKLQRGINPGRFDVVGRAARQIFRTLSGVKGDISDVSMKRNPQNPLQAIVKVDLKQVDAADVKGFRNMLGNSEKFLGMLGISD